MYMTGKKKDSEEGNSMKNRRNEMNDKIDMLRKKKQKRAGSQTDSVTARTPLGSPNENR
jgi:hypothetical protein